ncbi:ADP-glyceromanno-heptose 6-epimerase [Bradyrhizobium sp. SZCCHNS2005]|uniref:ADP-glyceromanno-heptose 6-epimerase n=1 Tax=Bradyrhizobium sp. SZCCHNS2005 TaxID=3057303 RepID=UPI0028E1BD32|nr:ADP-glyceromanno-heptose 6-epimerase [Bradyrhizobium sp. SZCCHNS2005]
MYLVTGGCGFIGSNIAMALAGQGADVVICDRLRSGEKWKNLVKGRLYDLILPETLDCWMRDHARDVAAIVHMGAVSSTTESDVDKIVRNNIRLSLRLWHFAGQYGVPLIYASSAATYGDGAEGFSDDESSEALNRLVPLNAYGWSKHVIDRRFVADAQAARLRPPQWAGLKFFNVYGPNEAHKGDMRSVVHKIYPKVAAGEEIELFKSHDPRYQDGGQLRDFIYVKDCVRIVVWLLQHPEISGLFNVGTGRARSFRDLAVAVGQAVGREPRIRYVDMPPAIRERYQYFTEADMTKLAASGLSLSLTSLERGVSEYIGALI